MPIVLLYGVLVGLSLGLTGGGGSILAVPLLVYGVGCEFRQAVALSLAIVGATALYGAVLQWRHRQVVWRVGSILGLGGVGGVPVGTYLGSYLSDDVSLLLFAGLMGYVGTRMLRPQRFSGGPAWLRCRAPLHDGTQAIGVTCFGKLGFTGFLTGILSGLFGVGGGFLLIPALMVVAQLPIAHAMATSLVAIIFITGSGVIRNLHILGALPWGMPALFGIGAVLGMTLGVAVKKRCSPRVLQAGFGVAVLGMAVFVVYRHCSRGF